MERSHSPRGLGGLEIEFVDLERNSPMKKLAAFLMILSVSVFTVGCGGKTDKTVEKTVTEKKTETTTQGTPDGEKTMEKTVEKTTETAPE